MDVQIQDHGSVVIVNPVSFDGRVWCSEHLPQDGPMWGTQGYVVEPRYVGAIVDGMAADGLVCGS